jgi:hypothetical protein
MLRKFTAALIAITLIAGPALAQNYDNAAPATPKAQTQSVPAAATAPAKATKTVMHVKHAKKHIAKIKSGTMHQARHGKPAKSHQANVGKTATKTTAAKHS